MLAVDREFIAGEAHQPVVIDRLGEARDHPAVAGVLPSGSLGRGNVLPGSDVDLLLLLADGQGQERPFRSHERQSVSTELHRRDFATAREQLDRSSE